MQNSADLTQQLYETLQELKAGKIDVKQAQAISAIAGRITDVAKTELDYMRVTRQRVDSNFFNPATQSPLLGQPAESTPEMDKNGARKISTGTVVKEGNTTTHRIG